MNLLINPTMTIQPRRDQQPKESHNKRDLNSYKKPQTKKCPGQYGFTAEFYKTLKKYYNKSYF